ncbi:hypothetical protein ACJMK2_019493 [Sinanodonta woodiana]|uniref:Leucine-rich repeat-containing protein 56 n=1 Tax=Sinanodonta woodiana TaxID=1069815 RepID=A0ABD3TWY0_SINWO
MAVETRHQARLQTMDPGFDRPKSALARGVQITEFKESCINPDPVMVEESELLMEHYLSPRKLRMLTGVDNLDDVKSLDLRVDTSETSLGNFGALLPNLVQLKVSNSAIPRIRDLGSSLRGLRILWMSRCGLSELDGISSMSSLKELYLSYNEISDISPLCLLDQLQILDLEGNNLDDISQVQHLGLCPSLNKLTLDGNPLCVSPSPNADPSTEYAYRDAVKQAIPNLKYLDDELLIEGVGTFSKHNVFDDDWAYLQELQNDMTLMQSTESLNSDGSESRPDSGKKSNSRPGTGNAALRPNSSYRPGSALRPSSGFRPLTAKPRPASAGTGVRPQSALPTMSGRPGTASRQESQEGADTSDASSELTLGTVICGNPSKALLSRRRFSPDQKGETEEPKFTPQFHHTPEHTYDPFPEEQRDRTEILTELREWRKEHEKRMEKIQAEQAPQVLRIDYDDSISLSGDESDVDNEPVDSDEDPILNSFTFAQDFKPATKFVPKELNLDVHQSSITYSRSRDSANVYSKHSFSAEDSLDISKDYVKMSKRSSDRDTQIQRTKSPLRTSQTPTQRNARSLRGGSPVPGLAPLSPSPMQQLNNIPVGKRQGELEQVPFAKETSQPIIRRSLQYDRPNPALQRPATARAVLALPSQPRIRRQLPQVPSLPSKPNFPM